ncbi:hypothetical protein [Tropicimonas sp. S265A]|uniref:hypothetical protein n=1 Tax=Tropicimonas sp. S265A TaxID=3415134 RepID=UPI003C7C90DE
MPELFTDSIIARVLEDAARAERIDFAFARAIAEAFPDASGLSLVFALTSAANGLEDFAPDSRVPALYRLAAMVSADLFAFEMRGDPMPDGRVLAALWADEAP